MQSGKTLHIHVNKTIAKITTQTEPYPPTGAATFMTGTPAERQKNDAVNLPLNETSVERVLLLPTPLTTTTRRLKRGP